MLLHDIFGRDFFDDFFNAGVYRPNRLGSIPAMRADVQEMEDSYLVELELPGFRKEDLQAELKNGYLTICANRQNTEEKKEKGRYICQERYSGHYQRSFYVGEDITEEDVRAAFTDGVLKLTIPKKEVQEKIPESKKILIEG